MNNYMRECNHKKRPRQVDLPAEIRSLFPASLGTLKHIKILTNAEYAELNGKPTRKDDYEENQINEQTISNCAFRERLQPLENGRGMNGCARYQAVIQKNKDCNQCPDHVLKSLIQIRRGGCSYHVSTYYGDKPAESYKNGFHSIFITSCILKGIRPVELADCATCQEAQDRSKWPVTFHLTPIETGNIEIPSLHYKRKRIEEPDRSIFT